MSTKDRAVYVKRVKRGSSYTVLSNITIADDRLSWASLGLLTYLLHHREDYVLKLYNVAKERKGKSGACNTRTALRGLENAGYVKVERVRDPKNGRFVQTVWYVDEEASFSSPLSENQEVESTF
jgi:hypothetical protein